MDLNELKNKAARISDETFGIERPSKGPMLKLIEEIHEVLEAINKGENPQEEFADCFLLLIDSYRKFYGNGCDMQALIDASSRKLDVVAKRKWGEPDENGVFKHIKE